MGCLIYYVLSAGSHPFGSTLKRQANIETGDFSLGGLMGEDRPTAEHLIKIMISFNNKFRLIKVMKLLCKILYIGHLLMRCCVIVSFGQKPDNLLFFKMSVTE